MQPLLSIVIPIYNNERTLKKMVDSILVQKFDDWELLLVDDGSTDSCPQIVDDYTKSDNRIKAFHKENGGTFTACNLGLQQVTGKYTIFGSADDFFTANAFEVIVAQTNEYDYDIILMNVLGVKVDSEHKIYKTFNMYGSNLTEPIKLLNKKDFEVKFSTFIHDGLLTMYFNCYKSSITKKFPYNLAYECVADIDMNLNIADSINSVSYDPTFVYNYTIYDDSNYNLSIGKYRQNEHKQLNEMYLKQRNLLSTWNLLDKLPEIAIVPIILLRERTLLYIFNNSNGTATQNIDIVTSYYDDILLECAIFTGNLQNVCIAIFNTINTIAGCNDLPYDFDNPIVRIIKALNNNKITFEQKNYEITNGLLDYRNPYRIGFETYKTTFDKEHLNIELINYIEMERMARELLFTSNFEASLDATIQLFNSKISTPEQYIILALCGYHLGLTEDAKNAVETGLQLFPNYPRLEELQNIINERNE
ncbi:MAG: glycosyltransferase family 2 protein [Firmicutes bacterium]|nr:glycosyltransferase family 2 protein [Bacillota bacterium]